MSVPLMINLGKLGDCINVLPFAYMMSKKLGQIEWLIGRQWSSLLEGCSYVKPKIFEGTDDQLHQAIRENEGRPMWVTQAWKNPDSSRETNSFAKEQWRYVGMLNERGKWPLVFDRRNTEREQKLIDTFIRKDRKNVLVGTTSVSTPYRHATRLLDEVHANLDANIIPLDKVKAERIYDLIGLYEAADLLVSVDTCHLHLVRAASLPVVSLVNDGWMGCVPPPQTIAAWRYAELGEDFAPLLAAAKNSLYRKIQSLSVICNSFDTSSDRHQRAMATHPRDMIYCKFDHRPTTKELFEKGLAEGKDAVVFTNDDVTFLPDTLTRIKAHLQKFDFGCSRRPRNPVHCGREIFWFRSEWLRDNWDTLPDVYWSVQKPDLIICRWMRNFKGIPTTLENLNYDFPPVEIPDVIEHEDHKSAWSCSEVESSPEGQHNEKIWREMSNAC